MNGIAQDVRYSLRQLRRSPGFTTVAILTLALGIGANTAIFTVVNALLLKMLPVKEPDRLVVVGDPADPNRRSNGTPSVEVFSYPLYKELRDHNSVFSSLGAAATDHRIEVSSGESGSKDEKVIGRMVSGNYFSTLGLRAWAGRVIADSDDTAEGANPLVVLGYAYWQRRFAGSASIVGTSIRLNGYPFTVIGIAPPGFDGDVVGEQMALFVPLSMQPQIVRGRNWRNAVNSSWLSLIGRLNPGVSAKQAEANLNLILQQAVKGEYGAALSQDDRNAVEGLRITVLPGGGGLSQLRASYRTPLFLLMGIVGLVLLIACVNVANLLLARMSARNREVAVRVAIGATARRVLQQMLTESLLLALLGGVAGCVLAVWGVRLLVSVFDSSASLPLVPDMRVLGFTLAVIAIAGILFGLAPAIRTLQVRVSPALKDSNRTTPGRSGRFSWGKGLIAGQVALSLLVLFTAGLLVRSLQKLLAQDFGYSREHLVISRIDPTSAGYTGDTMKPLAQELVSRLVNLPGITGVTYSTNGLFSGTESADAILVPGFNPPKIADRVSNEDYVGPDYFSVVGIPILSGRGIEDRDTATSARVAVVNEAMVKYFFGGQNPVGRQFRIDDPDWLAKPITIVGVSRNAKDHDSGLRQAVEPRFYLAMQQVPQPGQIVIEARTSGDASAAAANILSEIKSLNAQLPVSFVKPLETLVNDGAADQIALARLSGFFAALALVLACIGLYGVMSYTVSGRTREIGVRMALGARRADVVQLILREGLILVSAGIAAGIPLALAGSQFLHSFLFEMRSVDPVSLASVVLLLGLVGVFAGLIPARRAAKIDPMVALRYE
jgi:predicted permease